MLLGKKKGERDVTRRSSAETDDPCLSSETVSSLPRVGLRLCPGVVSTASLMLSIAISNTVPCRDLRDAVASLVKYGFSTVSKYSSCSICCENRIIKILNLQSFSASVKVVVTFFRLFYDMKHMRIKIKEFQF